MWLSLSAVGSVWECMLLIRNARLGFVENKHNAQQITLQEGKGHLSGQMRVSQQPELNYGCQRSNTQRVGSTAQSSDDSSVEAATAKQREVDV